MLVELSLFSWLAAFWMTANYVLELTRFSGHRWTAAIAEVMIWLGIVVQIGLLCGLRAVRTNRSKYALSGSLLCAGLGILIAFIAGLTTNLGYLRQSGWDPAMTPIALIFAAFAFERLGSKQWKQVIEEQIILVNARAVSLREMSNKWPS
jgi:hypothetical protein